MQTIQINSHKISCVLYEHHLLTMVCRAGERFLYQLIDPSTFTEFITAPDRDKFYRNNIKAKKEFKRIQLFG